jgi:hypothetical protein
LIRRLTRRQVKYVAETIVTTTTNTKTPNNTFGFMDGR